MNSTQENDDIVLATTIKKELEAQPKRKCFSYGGGLSILDKAVDGIVFGDFIIIGGIAGQGKTTFAISLTKEIYKQGLKPLWFSIELTPREFLDKFNGEDIKNIFMPRKIDEPRLSWLEKKIDEGIEKYGTNIVFIDHIGMIMDEKDYSRKNSLEVFDERVKTIKSWAVNKDIIIIAIFPAPQSTARETNKEPTLATFRGSSMAGHASDLAIVIKRMAGVKTAVKLNDRLDDESILSPESRIYILKCRRTGMQKAYVEARLDENGIFIEV